ncbi:MAG TPA: winged helix DNA-binding protein [Sphingomonas sp.]|jgi:predicted MarR family transcription regulator
MTKMSPVAPAQPRKIIVSSDHLASGEGWELSEVEFGLTVLNNAFQKWIVRCAVAAGQPELSATDVLVLHHVNHRHSEKKRVDICFMLNIEDAHNVTYALKRLIGFDLIAGTKRGKEIYYSTTAKGQELCEKYRQIRADCLLSLVGSVENYEADFPHVAERLRVLSGLYEQASRAAASL